MPKLATKFTNKNVGDLKFDHELAKLMKHRKPRKPGDDPVAPEAIDFFETAPKGRGAGLILTLNRSGIKTWAILYYVRGKPRRRKVGFFPPMSQAGFPSLKVEQARAIASKVDVDEEIKIKPGTFADEAEKWFKKQVEARKLRTAGEIRRQLNKYVLPHWRDRLFLEIRLGEVNDLLDTIESKHGARCADLVLATIRSLFNWFSLRHDDYTPPVRKGMARYKTSEHERDRIFDHQEIVRLWRAADGQGTFGAVLQVSLLTGQRRDKVAKMKWSDIKDGVLIPGSDTKKDGVWIIATEKREKGNAGALKLPRMVLDIIQAQPRLAGNDYVFGVPKGKGYLSGWSDCKDQIDKVLDDFEPWVIHDARRTCKSLCSQLHVDRVVSEALLGHKLKGVEGTYDRYSRFDEKSDAVQAVANYVSGLLSPSDKVVTMRGKKRKAA